MPTYLDRLSWNFWEVKASAAIWGYGAAFTTLFLAERRFSGYGAAFGIIILAERRFSGHGAAFSTIILPERRTWRRNKNRRISVPLLS